MNFTEYVEIDTSARALLLLAFSSENNEIKIKVDDKEIKEIKLKQDLIEFFTCNEDYSNPLAPEFKVDIYFNNYIIEYEVVGDDKEEVKKFCEYIKSILI